MLNFSEKKIIFFSIFFLVIIITLTLSFPFWTSSKSNSEHNKKNLKPLKYETIIEQISLEKPESLKQAESFIVNNRNIYGTLTSMFLAKTYITHNDFNAALIQLNNSLKYTEEENLKNILKIKIATINMQINQYDTAIKMIETLSKKGWKNIIYNLKGDLFFQQKKIQEAIKYWKKSLSEETSNASKKLIKMKINELK
ncbi:tetratricopeptide repeat protein [Buchnera aphidicola (Hyadaphis tataricae)]|uniref:Ancillary SecYEG translocon subunit n=1 Tax=Buchnera aphidicola (Hyadaphis tataricae) TaxID=1241859 RepID=A0A4D6Y7M9_9GAMM|nr:tetratricopeptide repeat protein [Buchnera aphidicola]QCI21870.1 tetratricopeptide repeat protein [Buchnera aphidicola (Hyadaphis tataricae)]